MSGRDEGGRWKEKEEQMNSVWNEDFAAGVFSYMLMHACTYITFISDLV